jgi:hypothetical protein
MGEATLCDCGECEDCLRGQVASLTSRLAQAERESREGMEALATYPCDRGDNCPPGKEVVEVPGMTLMGRCIPCKCRTALGLTDAPPANDLATKLRAMTEDRDDERLGRLAVERKVEDLETDAQRLANETAAARAERDEAKHQLDRVLTVLRMKPGDVIPGVGKVYRKRVDNGHFTWEIEGGVISQNNVVAAFERAERIASLPPAEPGSGTGPLQARCGGRREILYLFERPGSSPGNQMMPCPGCSDCGTPPVNTVKEG